MSDTSFCQAMTGAGTPVTVYAYGRSALRIMRKTDETLICTQDQGHAKGHAACDGQGHILARWPRSVVERYCRPGDCEGHDHSVTEAGDG